MQTSNAGNGTPATAPAEAAPVTTATGTSATSPPVNLELTYTEPSGLDKFWTNFRLAFALPWRRFKSDSVLAIKVRACVL